MLHLLCCQWPLVLTHFGLSQVPVVTLDENAPLPMWALGCQCLAKVICVAILIELHAPEEGKQKLTEVACQNFSLPSFVVLFIY